MPTTPAAVLAEVGPDRVAVGPERRHRFLAPVRRRVVGIEEAQRLRVRHGHDVHRLMANVLAVDPGNHVGRVRVMHGDLYTTFWPAARSSARFTAVRAICTL